MADKRQLIDRIASDQEDKLLLAKVYDKLELTGRRNVPTSTQFLNEHQRAIAERLINAMGNPKHRFVGGQERTVLEFLPDYECETKPVSYIRAEYPTMYKLDHRDFLGSLMGAGIKRETVGDINVTDGRADIAVLSEIVPYLMSNFASAGRARLKLSIIDAEERQTAADDYTAVSATVSSLRLDCIISAAFDLSRARASELVSAGRVQLDHLDCLKPDRALEEGSVVSVKGMGRAVLDGIGGQSRKGRTRVTIKRYGR